MSGMGSAGLGIARSKYIANWFIESDRPRVFGVMAVFSASGYLIAGAVINWILHPPNQKDEDTSKKQFRDRFQTLF
jgi:MFS family permease